MTNVILFSLPKTKSMQANIHISIAVSPSALGEFELMLLKMLTRTRKRVIRSAILEKKYVFFVIHTLIIYFPNICFVFWWLLQYNILSYITCRVQCLEESEKISRRLPRTNLQNTTIQFLLSASYNSHLMASSRWWYRR